MTIDQVQIRDDLVMKKHVMLEIIVVIFLAFLIFLFDLGFDLS